ncbi:GyrI-like domain-containing protein [Streptomyces sp. NPDC051940]|uniref:GyrI-like domain-containing protein n=1 Tax=Streptomyces sp. NPDC051940 TaxID=3155675 RepID=UPI00342DC271
MSRNDNATDLKAVHRPLYTARPTPALVTAPPLPFLTADGSGDPDGPGYREAVEGLYAVAYGVRAALKGAGLPPYPVMPLQGLWWSDRREDFAAGGDRSRWQWRMMILQPPQADPGQVADAIAAAVRKGRAGAERVRLETFDEGLAAQILHIGPYADEPATHRRLMAFIEAEGCEVAGDHHEIYLSHPARTAPEKLRTILRYPVRRTRA